MFFASSLAQMVPDPNVMRGIVVFHIHVLLNNKEFTGMTLSPCQQEIENQLSRPGVSYENRVSAVLSGWEHLAGTVEGDVGQLQPLASFLYK